MRTKYLLKRHLVKNDLCNKAARSFTFYSALRAITYATASLVLLTQSLAAAEHQFKGLARVNLIATDAQNSFFNEGTDITRWDKNQLTLSQTLLEVHSDWTSALSSEVSLFAYTDGEMKGGITEAFINYKPLQRQSKKWAVRAGLFYPELSVENADIGWLSRDTYSFSAINSWYAEELRIAGAELSYSQNGRSRRSPWSWDLRAAIYKGNDPIGSLIAWRGFAIHDRQTLLNEVVKFAPLPFVMDPATIASPNDVPPFREIDGRFGFYAGIHLSYLRKLQIKYYYYDNNADPDALTPLRYYAWDTKFHNLALQYQLSPSVNIKAQALYGNTFMGKNIVNVDYSSAFVQVRKQFDAQYKATVRLEAFDAVDIDVMPQENNHSNGVSATLNGQRKISANTSLGAEYTIVKNYAYNRLSLGEDAKQIVRQLQLVAEFRF